MARATIAILGGAGNTGRRLARLLARTGDYDLRLMGRTKASVDDAAARIAAETGATLVGVRADSSDRAGLLTALSGADLVVSATSSAGNAPVVASAALTLGIDYFDTHLSSSSKWQALRAIEPDILRHGLQFVSDGGFHPGLPAAMIRRLASTVDLTHAPVYASFNVDWSRLSFGAGAAEDFVCELREMDPSAFVEGRWVRSWRNARDFDFGSPVGRQGTIAMGIEELRNLPDRFPHLKETGFYIGGFGPIIDYAVLPAAMLAALLPPLRPLAAAGFFAALKRWTRREEWTVLVCDGRGVREGTPTTVRLRVSHDDPYELTAIAAAACVREMVGAERRPGLLPQGLYVDPEIFFRHLEAMGAGVNENARPA
ncbi:saccharopine dehydrogenase NADP-binding domain-containing protein [Pleomorphomonas sp. JP5]|uniref:saccharopine dehydrogenase NADP-binding domain-containing protein n=1 Tax=Pleomorphomonas sp. JP5 TaxID=2942998 RepID=UPI002042DBD1|nr:saccharopine dehydrogenase NADP-binding domain-containing protein [Pleomorphomonas sp. JP5]MCM5556618.1 saccharopine dehydrogenase NADP-binding domain-containing protein [Pleomorphomonas sp. JP5]